MKQYIKSLARPSFTPAIAALIISLGSSIIQYHPVSAEVNSLDIMCGSRYLSDPCGDPGVPLAPAYSDLKVNLAAAIIAILIVCAVRFADRKYFAKLNKKSSRPLAYATFLVIVLLAGAVVFAYNGIPAAWNNNWVSESSARVLAALAFVPAFAVLIVSFVRALQHKRRLLWVADLVLIAVAVYLVVLSIADIAGLWSGGL